MRLKTCIQWSTVPVSRNRKAISPSPPDFCPSRPLPSILSRFWILGTSTEHRFLSPTTGLRLFSGPHLLMLTLAFCSDIPVLLLVWLAPMSPTAFHGTNTSWQLLGRSRDRRNISRASLFSERLNWKETYKQRYRLANGQRGISWSSS